MMIKAIRKRARPDNLKNQVRAGGQSFARKLYLYCIVSVFVLIGWTFTGHWFFLDAEGLVTRERMVVAPDYSGRIVEVHVKPGDRVEAGQLLATLHSREITDVIAELTTRRGTVSSREAQLSARIETARRLLPRAAERKRRALEAHRQLAGLGRRGLTTTTRIQETEREIDEAEREESTLAAEINGSASEMKNLNATLAQMDQTIAQAERNYSGGRVIALADGLIGARAPSLGQIVKSGEPLFDLYRGEMFVLAYVPIGRLYALSENDSVSVSDGQTTFPGRVEHIKAVTDALPPEFQANFRAQDRQQIFSVAFTDPPPFAVLAKVRLSSNWSPYGMSRRLIGLVTGAGELVTGSISTPGRSAAPEPTPVR